MNQLPESAELPKAKHYKAIIRAGEPIQLTPAQADTIGLDMVAGNNSKTYKLKQHDLYLKVGDVRRIEPDYDAEILEKRIAREETERQASLLQSTKPKCHGQYSIQLEINRIAKDEGGANWAKLIRDQKWREETRQQLRETTDQWCDDRAGDCACESAYAAVAGRHNV